MEDEMSDVNEKKQILIDEIKKYNWDNVDGVIQAIIPNILFTVKKESSEGTLASRFGGRPAVPSDFEWPLETHGNKAPLAFYFQLNFDELKQSDINHVLPEKGLLLCFAGVTDDAMFDPQYDSGIKTYFFSDTNELKLMDVHGDLPEDQKLKPRELDFETSFQLPQYPFNYGPSGNDSITDDDAEGINEVAGKIRDEAISKQMQNRMAAQAGLKGPDFSKGIATLCSHNLILGIPMSVQHCIAEEWAELRHDDDGKTSGYVNLISFEMSNRDGTGFGDNGAHLYLSIDRDELKADDFSKVIAIIQNT
jgi:uncharacterized protein YwqG